MTDQQHIHGPILGCIADDLTGGAELASMLIARGIPTGFTIGAGTPLAEDCHAYVIALKSRVIPAAEAVTHVVAAADRLLEQGCRQFFFKYCATFDSTPRGNIGPCAEALLDHLGADFTMFCPTLCEVGRTVYQGHMFAGAQLLSESPKRHDPLTPMTDSNLVRVLAAQSKRAVGLIAFQDVDRGPEAIRERIEALRRAGTPLAIVDAMRERDLEVIGEAAADLRLMTGNSSVAAHLPPAWRRRGWIGMPEMAPLPGVQGRAAVIAGSVAERTAVQLGEFARNHPTMMLDLRRAMEGEDLLAEALIFARSLAPNEPLGFGTAMAPDEIAKLQARYGVTAVAARAEAILSDIADHLVSELKVRRLIISGGETAGAVLKKLKITRLRIGAYEGPGISRAVTEDANPIALVLKSGKLGPVDMFIPVLDAMRRPAEITPLYDRWPPAQR